MTMFYAAFSFRGWVATAQVPSPADIEAQICR